VVLAGGRGDGVLCSLMDALAHPTGAAVREADPPVVPDPDADTAPPPVEVWLPEVQTLPLVLASPHSGDHYPERFVAASSLDRLALRRSEDCHVHELFGCAPRLGAPLMRATFPRAYLDPNREPYELDPMMFDGPLPRHCNTCSPRVRAGLGTIARVVASGAEIYRRPLPVAEAERRIETLYRPYHATLRDLIERTRHAFGRCILIDCHSMPSGRATAEEWAEGVVAESGSPEMAADVVLGDCHSVSCARVVVATAQTALERAGLRVLRNAPYAGGYTTRHYGRPREGVHALQIEINRRLYMDERTYERLPGFAAVAAAMEQVVRALADIPGRPLEPR